MTIPNVDSSILSHSQIVKCLRKFFNNANKYLPPYVREQLLSQHSIMRDLSYSASYPEQTPLAALIKNSPLSLHKLVNILDYELRAVSICKLSFDDFLYMVSSSFFDALRDIDASETPNEKVPTVDCEGEINKSIKSSRSEIIKTIMSKSKDFNNRTKVLELAKVLDANDIPMIKFRARRLTDVRFLENPPGKYIEVAKNRKNKLYDRIFHPRTGALVKDLYKK